jgi:hypothetical protein
MTDRNPVAANSLGDDDAPASPWALAEERLANPEKGRTYWLATVRPDGRPRVMPLIGLWLDEAMYFVAGERTRKGRNLAGDPRCVITGSSTALPSLTLGMERFDPADLPRPTRWEFLW